MSLPRRIRLKRRCGVRRATSGLGSRKLLFRADVLSNGTDRMSRTSPFGVTRLIAVYTASGRGDSSAAPPRSRSSAVSRCLGCQILSSSRNATYSESVRRIPTFRLTPATPMLRDRLTADNRSSTGRSGKPPPSSTTMTTWSWTVWPSTDSTACRTSSGRRKVSTTVAMRARGRPPSNVPASRLTSASSNRRRGSAVWDRRTLFRISYSGSQPM
jgi:hypothetical protein